MNRSLIVVAVVTAVVVAAVVTTVFLVTGTPAPEAAPPEPPAPAHAVEVAVSGSHYRVQGDALGDTGDRRAPSAGTVERFTTATPAEQLRLRADVYGAGATCSITVDGVRLVDRFAAIQDGGSWAYCVLPKP